MRTIHGSFYELGVHFLGVFVTRALLAFELFESKAHHKGADCVLRNA